MKMTDKIGSAWLWKPQFTWFHMLKSGYVHWGKWTLELAL